VKRITLKPGRVAPVRGGHPWIFSGAIARGLDGCEPGEPVRVVDHEGHFAAVGYANPRTPIAVRVCALDDVAVDAALVARRLDEALALRRETLPADLRAHRVLNAEGDRLPGVVVDRYGDVCVVQLLTAGAARLGPAVVEALVARLAPAAIYERSEGAVRAEEGVPGTRGLLHGAEPPVPLPIEEHGARLLVDVMHGQKTGFFLDQRDNRQRVRALAAGRRVLNCFAYTGAFAVAAGLGGATHVTSIDTSRPALELGEQAWAASGLDPAAATWVEADVFDWLREGEAGTVFDVVVCDPPPFARRRRDRDSALRGYRDVNLQAFRRLAPGGWMLTCTCSQHLDRAGFREVVMHAAAAAGRNAQVVAELGHPADHPTALAHVEGEYLKALLLRA
jgi:23S rRNA (cytosine1962-C5)-methyltransferase